MQYKGILIEKVIFRYLVNSIQNQARSTSWHSAIDLLATPAIRYRTMIVQP